MTAAVLVLLCAALTALAPLRLLLWSPLLLGVPHICADFWCLFIASPKRPSPRLLLILLIPLALLTIIRALSTSDMAPLPRTESLLGVAAAAAGILTARRTSPGPAAAAWLATAALAVAAWTFPRNLALGFAYAHNALAFALWLFLSRGSRSAWIATAAYLLGTTAFGLGLIDPVSPSAAWAEPSPGFSLASLAKTLAPASAGESLPRWISVFAFGQAVHYAAWLYLLPRELPDGTLSRVRLNPWFAPAAAAAAAICVLVALLGTWRPVATRDAYLALAAFHGWLELGALLHAALDHPAPAA